MGQQRLAFGDAGMASQIGRVDGGLDHLDFNKEGWEQNGDETQRVGFAARTENTPPASNANLSGCPRDFKLTHDDKARGSS